MPGIEYKISVSGANMLGIQGERQQFSIQVMPDTKKSDSEVEISSSQLVLKGPAITLSNAVSYVEATFVSCVPQVMRPNLIVSIHSVNSLSASYNPSEK
jgi:CRISPR/Cas system CMR-associated protein Cmr5 small subunit